MMTPSQFGEAATAIAQAWPWFWPCVGAVMGAVLGSFAECAIYRIPRRISLRRPPSMCPSCHQVLGIPDLVPVISYIVLRGRCRHCHVPIGSKAIVLEVTLASLGAVAVFIAQFWYLAG